MSWFLLALASTFVISITVVLDQYVIRKYLPDNSTVVLLMGELFYFLPVLLFAPFYPPALNLEPIILFSAIGLGMWSLPTLLPYIWALEKDDTHIVLPLFQLTPIIVLFLGWLLLGESIPTTILAATILVILASMGLVYDFQKGKIKFRLLSFILMSSFALSLFFLGERYLVQRADWLAIALWVTFGEFIAGVIAFFLRRDLFSIMLSVIKSSKGKVLIFSLSQETFYILSLFLTVWGLALAPSAGVFRTIADSFLPAFGFILSGVLALFLPQQFEKHTNTKLFLWKVACITLIITGSAYIYLHSNT